MAYRPRNSPRGRPSRRRETAAANTATAPVDADDYQRLLTTLPLSLYIHFPWCQKKCPYCDFNAYATQATLPEREYIDALLRDLETELPRVRGRRIHSVFIGGGTPSLFSGKAIQRMMKLLAGRLQLSPGVEVTLEANPGTLTRGNLEAYHEAGVNRISLGVQSFDDERLRGIGRIHDAETARRAIGMIQEAGFTELNVDLMFGLPGQSRAGALNDLNIALECAPTHISWYQLTVEPNTVFHARRPPLPDHDLLSDIQQQGQALLRAAGFEQYEVSAYAKAGDAHQCRHNLNYWCFGDYLGIGAGAHAKLTQVDGGAIKRYARHRIPPSYMRLAGGDAAIAEVKTLEADELPLEFMMNALRLNRGIHPALFTQRTGLPLHLIEQQLEAGVERSLISYSGDTIKATGLGRRYLNDTLQLFCRP